MKVSALCLNILTVCILITTACKKKEAIVPEPTPTPDPYTYSADLQSSKDISMATFAISDIDMMCAFLGERNFFTFYVMDVQVTSSGSVTGIIDTTSPRQMVLSFNDVSCTDGRKRNGSVLFNYEYDANANPLAKPEGNRYSHFGFSTSILLFEYIVNGWKIEVFDPAKPAHITCMLTSSAYNPAQTNLSWKIAGKFKFTHPTQLDRDIIWDGEITKTLMNTNDPAVFASDVYWPKAKVSYTGVVTGSTSTSLPFTYTIDNTNPLVRDFNCSFILPPPGSIGATQFHPFIKGSATFASSNYHPRSINYGPAQDCDNKGTVSFHGETYNVDFE